MWHQDYEENVVRSCQLVQGLGLLHAGDIVVVLSDHQPDLGVHTSQPDSEPVRSIQVRTIRNTSSNM